MNQSDNRPAAAERARWLAELATAVDTAQRLARSLGAARGNSAELDAIHARLEAIQGEVEQLRGGGRTARPTQLDPDWTSIFTGLDRPRA